MSNNNYIEADNEKMYDTTDCIDNVVEPEKDTFEKTAKMFFSSNKVRLYILTPCFGGICHINYLTSLIQTISLFKDLNIELKIEFCKNDSLISRARNNLIARAMNDPECTHMLFIDNDITWQPIDIIKLLISEKDLIGGIYPLKRYDWEKLVQPGFIDSLIERKKNSQFAEMISDTEMIKFNLLKYNVNYLSNSLEIVHNLSKIKHLPTGFMMMTRKMIQNMMTAFPSTKYTDDVGFLNKEENDMAYALFDCGVEDGHYYSEDWLFCHRWSKMGGDVWMDVSINLVHSGVEDYNGSYLSTILQSKN